MVAFQGKDVVGALVDDLLGDGRLGVERIDRNDATVQKQ